MNQRRLFMLALGTSLSSHVALLRAQTPSGSMRRVGVLTPSTQANEEISLKPFFDQMRRLGWVEGHNIAYDRAYADGRQEILPRLAAEMVKRKPELIYAPPTVAAVAAKQATQTIPIVFGLAADPVDTGLVMSPARPGGNVTGISGVGASLGRDRMTLRDSPSVFAWLDRAYRQHDVHCPLSNRTPASRISSRTPATRRCCGTRSCQSRVLRRFPRLRACPS